MKVNPCKGCKERSADCHGSCERYAEWRQDHIERKREINKEKYPELYDYIVEIRYRGKNNNDR